MDLQQLLDLRDKLDQDLKVSNMSSNILFFFNNFICELISSIFFFYVNIFFFSDDMYSRSAGAAPATGPTPPGTAPQKAGDYAGYGNYTGYQQV